VLGVAAIAAGLWGLRAERSGLRVEEGRVDGIPVTLFAPAEPTAGTAPAVVVAHGFAGSRQLMYPFATALARNGYTAVVFDFPGHGRNREPLGGDLGDPERTESLLSAFTTVVEHARGLPGTGGRLATLGHSMAGDIQLRYAASGAPVDASVLVSPYLSPDVDIAGPANLLFVFGALEPPMLLEQGREAVAAATGLAPDAVEPGTTYGRFADGSARRLVIADGVEHIGVLYSAQAQRAALDWLDRVYGRDGEGRIAAGAPALGWLYLGVVLLAWPLSGLLPRTADRPLGAGLGWRRLLPVALLPPALTPVLLAPLPNDFLPIVIGDYLALHFALYGLLTLVGLFWIGQRPAALWRGVSARAWLVALVAVGLYETLALALPTDRFVAAFVPGADRIGSVLVLLAGTLLWAAADEWLTRGGPARGAYWLTKALFVLSLLLAVALNLNELFFLVIIVPAVLALCIVYGLFSGWVYRRTAHPMIAAVTNAIAFTSAIAASFPIVG
jgi:dienelactone hydrolase